MTVKLEESYVYFCITSKYWALCSLCLHKQIDLKTIVMTKQNTQTFALLFRGHVRWQWSLQIRSPSKRQVQDMPVSSLHICLFFFSLRRKEGKKWAPRLQKCPAILKCLPSQSVACGPAMSASYGCLLEMQKLRLHPRSADSESAF